ncbi:MAG: hypothetical protein QNJ87_10660 [Gammaproteobacteria bacterium]|nr:hypothetical protein [Gammaproteobacteria bacterium]
MNTSLQARRPLSLRPTVPATHAGTALTEHQCATLSGLVMEKGEPAGRAEVKLVDADTPVSKVR